MKAKTRIPEDIIKLDEMRATMDRLAEVLHHVEGKAIHAAANKHEVAWCIEKGLVEQPDGWYTSGAHFVGPGESLPLPDKPVRLLTSKGRSVLQHLTQLESALW